MSRPSTSAPLTPSTSQFRETFTYHKQVQFYDTDCMKIVHHANYLRYFEEARVAWLNYANLMRIHAPFSDLSFAVLSSSLEHHSSCGFADELEIKVQIRRERAKLRFQYAVYKMADKEDAAQERLLVATGQTLHVALDGDFRVCRIPIEVKKYLESEAWTEIWP